MKHPLVFACALVLVAQGKAAPFKEEQRVKEVQSEEVAGYDFVDAEQEGGLGPQGAYAEEAQGKAAPSKEEQRVKEVQSEEVAGYDFVDAEQEGGVGPQGAYAEEAQGKAAPSKEEQRVKEVQSEGAAGYAFADAEQEGGVGPQGAYAQEAAAVFDPNVVDAGPEQRAFAVGESAAERNIYGGPDTFYIPIISRACTNSACENICNLLGYRTGMCLSVTTCRCYI